MAYTQHRFLNPSQPKAYWPDAMPMRASLAPNPGAAYTWPPLNCNTPYPWSRPVGAAGLGAWYSWIPGLGPTLDTASTGLTVIKWVALIGGLGLVGYTAGFLFRELKTENRRRGRRRNARRSRR